MRTFALCSLVAAVFDAVIWTAAGLGWLGTFSGFLTGYLLCFCLELAKGPEA